VERSLSITELQRTIYTGFDFLSDVGGLSGILMSFLAITVGIWNYNSFENLMASNLFKYREREDDKGPGRHIQSANMPNFLDIILATIPSSFKCC